VIDPARLASRPAFERQMQELVTRALAGPVAAGHDSIRFPGQRGLRQREQQLESGVVLHGSIMPRLAAWAKKFDVEPPLPL
jgi:LDH2 family malate/lactate/ureidoglycolate dehydrogenase